MRVCVCLDGQRACRAWKEACFWQQLGPQFYILRWCLDSTPAFLSLALLFSIRGDHKLLSAVITAVQSGPAEGSQPVLLNQVRAPLIWAVGRPCERGKTQHKSLKGVLFIQEPEANENDPLDWCLISSVRLKMSILSWYININFYGC